METYQVLYFDKIHLYAFMIFYPYLNKKKKILQDYNRCPNVRGSNSNRCYHMAPASGTRLV